MPPDNPSFSVIHFSTGRLMRGGERQVAWLHQGLLKQGHTSVLACRKGGELALLGLKNTVLVPWHGEWDIAGLVHFIRTCKKHMPSIIHCHDSHALTHGALIGKLIGVPVIYTRRVAFPLSAGFLSKKKYGCCAAIVAVSNAVASQCSEIVPRQRIYIVHDGVDWNTPLLDRKQARKWLDIPDNCFVIGTVAHFTAEKDVALLMYLASNLDAQKPGCRLVCIGPCDEKLKQNAPFPASIMFKGKLDNAVQYYLAFDAYVSTSAIEGLGSALLDAIVRDIPCVAVDAFGTRDLFPEAGELVKRGDREEFVAAVGRLMNNYSSAGDAAKRLGLRSRDIFSVDAMVNNTLAVYSTFVGR
jgi:glycosyltransferase involved in cell wall biosynthesis